MRASELVVTLALRGALPEYLIVGGETDGLTKFIAERQRPDAHDDWALAA